MRSLFQKGVISDELICLYDIQFTNVKFLGEVFSFLVLLIFPTTKYVTIIILKDESDIAKAS